MPESIIRKVEELAEKEKVDIGLHFRNRHQEMFEWENEEYDNNQNESESEVAPYPDIAAELPGIELEGKKDFQQSNADGEKDENEEAVESEKNCTLDNLPNMNNPEELIHVNPMENPVDEEIIEINQERTQTPRWEEILVIDEENDIFDEEKEEIKNENYNTIDNGIENHEITGVDNEN